MPQPPRARDPDRARRGKTQTQIAAALVISPKTVATHIQHLLGKLGVNSRPQAVAVAYRSRLVAAAVVAHGLSAELPALEPLLGV